MTSTIDRNDLDSVDGRARSAGTDHGRPPDLARSG